MAALAKRIGDANIICAMLAVNCIEALAKGLRRNFAPYKPVVTSPLLEKCKEKKQNVVDALRAALDAVALTVELGDILEDIAGASKHKNPSVKAESVRWLVRVLKTIRKPPAKPEIKTICETCVKLIDDSQADVREASFEALGTIKKAAGERNVNPFLGELDSIKEGKIQEFYDKAEVKVVFAPPVVARKAPPPAKLSKPAPKKVIEQPDDVGVESAASVPVVSKPKIPAVKPPVAKAEPPKVFYILLLLY